MESLGSRGFESDFNARPHYDSARLQTVSQPIRSVLNLLDLVLFDTKVLNAGARAQVNANLFGIEKYFDYYQVGLGTYSWPIENRSLLLSYCHNKLTGFQSYQIGSKWRLEGAGGNQQFFQKNYGISLIGRSGLQSFVEQPNVLDAHEFELRPMSEYDLGDLREELTTIISIEKHEQRTNKLLQDLAEQ